MSGQVLFFEYIAAIFLGLSGLGLVFMSLLHGGNRDAAGFRAMLLFLSFNFLNGSSLFFFYYREVILKIYQIGALGRAIDYTIALSFVFTWFWLAACLMGRERLGKLLTATGFLFAIALASRIFVTVFLQNGDYYVADPTDRIAAGILYALVTLTAVFLLFLYLKRGLHLLSDRLAQRYILFSSLLLVAWLFTELAFTMSYLYGLYPYSSWGGKSFDPTGVILVALNAVTLFFIYKADFSPLFVPQTTLSATDTAFDLSYALDRIALAHRLTEREREVLILVYHGFTNPDIAARLGISINTAKRHIHHIFEKLDISSRIELVHLINSQM